MGTAVELVESLLQYTTQSQAHHHDAEALCKDE